MLIAQITDFHVVAAGELLGGRLDTGAMLAAAVARLNALDPAPDLVIATGDLVADGATDQYVHLRDCLAPLASRLVLMAGNHDDHAALAAAFPDHAYLAGAAGGMNYVAENGPPRILALDTVVPGEPGGHISAPSLQWLDDRLAEHPDRPTIIAMHHPPLVTGLAYMDAMNCRNGDDLARVLSRHRQVERILCGHLHRQVAQLWNGILVTTAPATSFYVGLDLRPDAPLGLTEEPPAFLLHWWRPDHGLISHTCYVEDFAGE